MDRTIYKKASDPFQLLILKNLEWGYGYLYVSRRVDNDFPAGVKHTCPNCGSTMLIRDVRKWRSTGAGLICNICSGAKPGQIVSNDNYEVLKIGPNNNVIIPTRLKKAKSNFENESREKVDADIKWITKELESDPTNLWLYVHRAGLLAKKYYGQKNYEEVWRADLEKALNIEPDNPMVYAWQAYLSTSKTGCIESLKRVLELDPSYESAYLILAHAYVQNDKSKCKTILEEALNRFPDSTRMRELYDRYVNCLS